MNLGLEAPVQLPFLIVHLTQDHVVLQEKFVSDAKSEIKTIKGKEKKEIV